MWGLCRPRGVRLGICWGLAAVMAATWAGRTTAHEIPSDVLVQAFARPDGGRLRVLVRAPLAAMRDMVFPETPAGHLDLSALDPVLLDAAKLWIADALAVFEDGVRTPSPRLVAARVSLPADRAFATYDDALAHFSAPRLPAETTLVWNQALLDVILEWPISSEDARFAIEPAFGRLGIRVATTLRFLPPGSPERAFHFRGNPGRIDLDPSWQQAAWRFVVMGFEHILGGLDHLLFLLCLVAPFRRIGALVAIVTAFTVAHSITLAAASLGAVPDRLWFPPLVETLIAVSILYMALENVVLGASGPFGRSAVRRRWILAFGFGLIHGFGFSFALSESLQFAGAHLVTSLAAFNVGVELGQLLVLAGLVPVLALLFRGVVTERVGVLVISVVVAHSAWHWMTSRGETLSTYSWTTDDARLIASVVRVLLVMVSAAAAIWLVHDLWRRRRAVAGPRDLPEGPAPRT